MTNKIRVAILCGGKSAEHEVSLQSARNIVNAIDEDKYEVVLLGIDKQGRWSLHDRSHFLLNADNPKLISLNKTTGNVALVTGESSSSEIVSLSGNESPGPVDVVFPVLHGPFGEDGTIQGLLKLMDVPFVGASVLGSAAGMDKDVMKRLLREANIPISDFLVYQKGEAHTIQFDRVKERLGAPVFIKPANLGSSVGIHKVASSGEFDRAIQDAFRYDRKLIIEEAVKGRELECSVLGNEDPLASIPGEIIPQHEFYSYEAKYIDDQGALLEIPANLTPEGVKAVQTLAVQTFKVLCCEGMARVDFFLTPEDKLYVNEINTIPGFTKISMYPKLWEASGISQTELVDRLIQLALARFEQEKQLRTSVQL
ncbi:MAG: D-alanine--D-alanine ligase [bacterium]